MHFYLIKPVATADCANPFLRLRGVDAGYVRAVRYFAVATLFLTMTSPKASYSPDSLARQTHGKLH